MCGIAGIQAYAQNNKATIRQMLDVIRHRGPDEDGLVEVDDVTLGHVRLSIIDIEHGQQPVQTSDERYSMVFNGEIYNYMALRQHLNEKGCKLRTYSDSEVLLMMYVEYGKQVVDFLNGMFAFAIYDRVEKTIFLARDHLGVKPLYYSVGPDYFVFGSEIKALLKHPLIKAEINEDALHEYLTFQFVTGENTMFRNILKLEPATYLVVRNGRVREKKEYWQIKFDIDNGKSEEQFADELLVQLDNTLARQVRSDVPIGAHLSGGLDSSAVSVLASKNYMGQLKTFTGGFAHSNLYNETKYARIVSAHINSDYHEVFPDYKDFIESIEKLIWHMDEPSAGPGVFPQFMVSKLASEHVKVVLGGQGGDEVFGGYARYAVAYLEQCIKGAIFESQEEGQHVVTLNQIIKNLPLLQQYIPTIKKQFSQGLFDDMPRRYFGIINRSTCLNRLYSDEIIKGHNRELLYDKFYSIFSKPDTKSYFNKMTYFDIKTHLPSLLHVEDRVSMAVSLESRVPLLDKRIVELASQMPPTMKFAGGKTKYMLHKALKNMLPDEILQRKDKMGFPVPLNEWFAGPLKEFVMDILLSKTAKERGILNMNNVIYAVEQEGKFDRDVWGALNIELWYRKFID